MLNFLLKKTINIFIIALILTPLVGEELVSPILEEPAAVEFTEHLGEYVPDDINLIDENGSIVSFDNLIDKPTILMFVYYECPGICTPLLTEVADVLGKANIDHNKTPFQLITVSFDVNDRSDVAAQKRQNYLKQINNPFPKESWRFFTGDQENIDKLTNATGFRYQRAGTDFTHPGGLILLSPEKKIVRYLYGIEFLPFEFKMGIMEASQGKVSPTTAKLLRYCFSYDPIGRTYAFNIARVTATVMITSVAFFGVFLIFVTRNRKKNNGSR